MIANHRYQCSQCGVEYRFRTTEQQAARFRCPKCDSNTISQVRKGTDAELAERWRILHTLAVSGMTESEFQEWQVDTLVLLSGCGCRGHWQEFISANPAPFTSADDQFRWAWFAHDEVSRRIGKPRISLAQAYGIHRKKGRYETDVSYLADKRVDVIIPYCDADKHFVSDAIRSILESEHVQPTIHAVSDASTATKKSGPRISKVLTELKAGATLEHYKASVRLGPYRIANIIASQFAKTNFIALLDADDISRPDRLWKQLATLQRFGYEMTSGSMVNFVDDRDLGSVPLELRHQNERCIESGVVFDHVPFGRCVNSVRTMSREMFLRLNGFAEEICSVDFDFDNRCHFAGVPVFWASDVVGQRRLHSASLTNGPEFAHTSTNRQRSNQLVKDNLARLRRSPGIQTAAALGGLSTPT